MTTVFISPHCRNPELFGATKLVFDTIRIGFPTAKIVVPCNNLGTNHWLDIKHRCEKVGAQCRNLPDFSHMEFIASTLLTGEPFWFCDTDIFFWDNMERLAFSTALAGRRIPKFQDPYTRCETQTRLHTSLMYVNPEMARKEVSGYLDGFPAETPYNPLVSMVRPFFHRTPEGRDVFYDCCAMLSYHVSTMDFNEDILNCYDHLNCGTFSDILEKRGFDGMVERQRGMCKNPELARGLWRKQEEWYATHV